MRVRAKDKSLLVYLLYSSGSNDCLCSRLGFSLYTVPGAAVRVLFLPFKALQRI